MSVAASLQAVTPYPRATLQQNPFSQSIMGQQALGQGRQRTGVKSRVSLDLVWSNKGHDSESMENRSEFQLGKQGQAIRWDDPSYLEEHQDLAIKAEDRILQNVSPACLHPELHQAQSYC